LSTTVLPVDALNCNVLGCTEHRNEVESYYADLVLSMHSAAKLTIPSVKVGVEKHWWTPELDDLKRQCIDATELWKVYGKPRSGELNANRVRIKFRYKNAIKEAARNSDTIFSDALYDRLYKKKSWRKHFCMKNLQPTGVLNGKYGDEAVRQEFTNHFKGMFTPNNSFTENCMKGEV